MNNILLLPIVGIIVGLLLLVSISNNVYGVDVNLTDYLTMQIPDYLTMQIPNNWSYIESPNGVSITPKEFGELLLDEYTVFEKLKKEGAHAWVAQDWDFKIKNPGLELYAKHRANGANITYSQSVPIDNEPAINIHYNRLNDSINIKSVEYLVIHDQRPYVLSYMANVKDFEKYLPQFEQMVKTFKFAK